MVLIIKTNIEENAKLEESTKKLQAMLDGDDWIIAMNDISEYDFDHNSLLKPFINRLDGTDEFQIDKSCRIIDFCASEEICVDRSAVKPLLDNLKRSDPICGHAASALYGMSIGKGIDTKYIPEMVDSLYNELEGVRECIAGALVCLKKTDRIDLSIIESIKSLYNKYDKDDASRRAMLAIKALKYHDFKCAYNKFYDGVCNKDVKLSERTMKLNPENYIAMIDGYLLPGESKKTLSTIYILDKGPICKQRNAVLGDWQKDDFFLITLDVGGEPEQHANYNVLSQWKSDGLCGISHRSFVNCFQWDGQGVEWTKNLERIINVAGSKISLSNGAKIVRSMNNIKIFDWWSVDDVYKIVMVSEFSHNGRNVHLSKVSGTGKLTYKKFELRLKLTADKLYICTAQLAPEGEKTWTIKKRSGGNIFWWEREYDHLKYAIQVAKIYQIKPDAKKQEALFKDLCTNGLFNQWNYIAPCNRLKHKFCDPEQLEYPEIALFRVYEIQNEINRSNLITFDNPYPKTKQSRFWDEFKKDSLCMNVEISHPVIPDDEFEKIKRKLDLTLEKHDMIRY